MEKILIELILTNQCNKRCEYCDLDFKNKSLSFHDLDLFIDFLKNNPAEYTINFFGGEPLLAYDKLQYFIENTQGMNINFSLGTNGVLLNKQKLEFLKSQNIKIHLSVDNISFGKDQNLELCGEYSHMMYVNFINDPDYLDTSVIVYDQIRTYGFKNIAFMPAFNTKKWDKQSLGKLKQVYKNITENTQGVNLETYTYFNGVAIDKQFILDTDLYFYSDLDSLLWLQKQYKNLDIELKSKIEHNTQLLSLGSDKLTLKNLISSYNIDEILKLVFEIPKQSGDLLSYKVIDKILKNGT